MAAAASTAVVSLDGLLAVGLGFAGGLFVLADIDRHRAVRAKARICRLRHRGSDEQGQDDQE